MHPQFSHSTLATLIRIFQDVENRIFDFDIPALDLTSFEWTHVLSLCTNQLSFYPALHLS